MGICVYKGLASISNHDLYSSLSDKIRYKKNAVQPDPNAMQSKPMSFHTYEYRKSIKA